MAVMEMEAGPVYANCGRRLRDLKPGRLFTLTGEGSVRRYDTGEMVNPGKISIILENVSHMRPARAAMVQGVPVNNDGTPRKNGTSRQWIVTEGTFLVWWE